MNEKEIREWIDFLNFKVNVAKQTGYSEKQARVFSEIKEFLEQYLSVKLPEERVKQGNKNNSRFNHEVKGFNKCLHLCKLSIVKAVPSELDIKAIIVKSKLYQGFQCDNYVIRVELMNQLATALHQMFLGSFGGHK